MTTGLFYWEGKHAKTQAREIELYYEITAAKTIAPLVQGYPALSAFDGYTSQAEIDAFLGSTNEFLLADLADQTDSLALIIRMGSDGVGQADTAVAAEFELTGATKSIIKPADIAAAAADQYELGANGNLACRFTSAGLDALTSGIIKITLKWISK